MKEATCDKCNKSDVLIKQEENWNKEKENLHGYGKEEKERAVVATEKDLNKVSNVLQYFCFFFQYPNIEKFVRT